MEIYVTLDLMYSEIIVMIYIEETNNKVTLYELRLDVERLKSVIKEI